jgi:hypothetical protein
MAIWYIFSVLVYCTKQNLATLRWRSGRTKERGFDRLIPGLPDFSWYNIPKRGKNIPNDYKITKGHKTYPMVVKYFKRPEYITTICIPMCSKIYPNRDFWSEKKPSGNPGLDFRRRMWNCWQFLLPCLLAANPGPMQKRIEARVARWFIFKQKSQFG